MILAVAHLHPPLDCALSDFTGLLLDTVRARHPKGGGVSNTGSDLPPIWPIGEGGNTRGPLCAHGYFTVLCLTQKTDFSPDGDSHSRHEGTPGRRGEEGEMGRRGCGDGKGGTTF